ncbi:hypothetical protein F4815DRAFT_467190 [Daldinia loculata]|nr:hypothetical protein F4815DRAFT_467190 [Daldinia loculata]
MDSYGRAIVDLSDEQHPNYDLTKLNNSSKFFSMLPREVRLVIYEYAVYVSHDVKPRQLVRGSNRFSWFSWCGHTPDHVINKWLTVVSLARVCRTIYTELEYFQPFYKVNQFSFMQLSELRKYIAAITPSRRQAIRRISYTMDGSIGAIDDWLLNKRVLWDHDEYPIDHGTLTILSQTGLEEFTLVVDLSDSWADRHPDDVDIGEICYYVEKAQGYPDELHTIWNLPCFRLGFLVEFPDETTEDLIDEIDEALEARRRRIGPDKPEWFKQLNSSRSAEKALCEVSDLDILGEDRVGLDRAGSYLGPVSSRTRGKCRVPNSVGQILKSVSRYSIDGILTSPIQGIHDIRWDGTDVQCQVSHKYGDKVWEDVSAILIPDNVFFIISFYNIMMAAKDSSRLDKVKSKPTLRDILKIQGGLHFLQHTGAEGYRKESLSFMRECWLRCANRWDAYIADLERVKTSGEQREETPQEAKGRTRRRG